MDIPTWAQFWDWIRTPAGLGVAVVAILGALKRLADANVPAWLKKVGQFCVANGVLVSLLVAGLLSLIIFGIGALGLEGVIGKYFVIFALAWVASQGAYALQKAGSRYVRSATGGATTTSSGPRTG